jgi:hypothetical protein
MMILRIHSLHIGSIDERWDYIVKGSVRMKFHLKNLSSRIIAFTIFIFSILMLAYTLLYQWFLIVCASLIILSIIVFYKLTVYYKIEDKVLITFFLNLRIRKIPLASIVSINKTTVSIINYVQIGKKDNTYEIVTRNGTIKMQYDIDSYINNSGVTLIDYLITNCKIKCKSQEVSAFRNVP